MTAFAGIIRHDGTAIPEEWLQSFSGKPSMHVFRPANGISVLFATWSRGVKEECGAADYAGSSGRVLLLDARIDNREALGLALPEESSDADLVSRAIAKWGEEAPARLIGEFAIAHWDAGRRRLFLARDILGSRPIFYYSSESLFAFSTELPVILSLPFVPQTLCEDTIADYLNGDGSGPPAATFYEAVRALPAAHTLVLDDGRFEQTLYWSPKKHILIEPSGVDYALEMRKRISDAVECRLRRGKKVAVHLSGGLDSSSIACLAARSLKRQGKRLLAICSLLPQGHDGPETDERSYIEAVLSQEDNIDPVWVRTPLTTNPFGALSRWFDASAQISYSTVTHIEEQLGEAGRAHGADVVLSGFGGDLFASIQGQYAIREQMLSGQLRSACLTLMALHREQNTDWLRLLWREVLKPLLAFTPWFEKQPGAATGCANPDFLERLSAHRDRRQQASTFPVALWSPWEKMRFVLAPGHIERLISAFTQIFAREFAQEIRFPLLDSRVIEWMLNMPADEFQRGGWPRSLMRRAMVGILPERIRLRRDKGGAFDPAITSRLVSTRDDLVRWAEETRDQHCWSYVDRVRFIESLQAVKAAPRGQWGKDVFRIVLIGGFVARFIEWHERGKVPL